MYRIFATGVKSSFFFFFFDEQLFSLARGEYISSRIRNPRKKDRTDVRGSISKADAFGHGSAKSQQEGQKAAAICQSKITEARNASHTVSTNAPRPAETKGANSRRQRVKSVPHEFLPILPPHTNNYPYILPGARMQCRLAIARYSRNEGVRLYSCVCV